MVRMQPQGSHFRDAASKAKVLCDRIFKVSGEGPALMNDCGHYCRCGLIKTGVGGFISQLAADLTSTIHLVQPTHLEIFHSHGALVILIVPYSNDSISL